MNSFTSTELSAWRARTEERSSHVAGRRGGFATMPLTGAGLKDHGKKLRPDGVDFVDVAALETDGFPFAVAALGLDCSIHLVSDLLADRATMTLQLNSPKERAYRILCTEGHVFMLTDKALYTFKDLAGRFLRGEAIDEPTAPWLEMEAVDASLGPARSLLILMPDTVDQIEIDSLLAGVGPRTGREDPPRRCSRRVPLLSHGSLSGTPRGSSAGSRNLWSLLERGTPHKVPFRIWSGILRSDEAIVAVLAHEMHEILTLRPLLESGGLPIDDLILHTEPGRPGHLHDEAWDIADRLVDQMQGVSTQ